MDIIRKEDAILICFISFLLLVLVVHASTAYVVGTGGNKEITEFSTCKKVTNNGAYTIFIPTGSNTEWQTFYNNPPTGVTIGSCVPTSVCGSWNSGYACRCAGESVCPYTFLGTMGRAACRIQCSVQGAECCEYGSGGCYKNWGNSIHISDDFGGWYATMC